MSKQKGMERLFDGRHFDREIIVLCVRWYLRYKLSLRDLVEMIPQGGLPAGRGRARIVARAHNDHALGKALYTGVRQALEPVWHAGRLVLAR